MIETHLGIGMAITERTLLIKPQKILMDHFLCAFERLIQMHSQWRIKTILSRLLDVRECPIRSGARCGSVVTRFAHGAMARSSQCFTIGVTKAVVCVILSVG